MVPVLSASNFIPHDPCTCLCPMASRDILRSFEAFLPWIILIPFAGTFSWPPYVIINCFRHAGVFAGAPHNKFHRFWDLAVDRHVKITENAVKIYRNWPKVVVFFLLWLELVVGGGPCPHITMDNYKRLYLRRPYFAWLYSASAGVCACRARCSAA